MTLALLKTGLILLALALVSASARAEVLHSWDFDDEDFAVAFAWGCTPEVRDGRLVVEKEFDTAYMAFPAVSVPGPVSLVMRVRTDPGMLGRGEVYWLTENRPGWDMERYLRFSMTHDGAWREYEVGLPMHGTLTHVRLAFGETAGRVELDWVRLVAAPVPGDVAQGAAALPDEIAIENDDLRLLLKPAGLATEITDTRTGRTWRGDDLNEKLLVAGLRRRGDAALELDLWDSHSNGMFTAAIALDGPKAVFDLKASNPDAPVYGVSTFPPALSAGLATGKAFFCDRSSGVYMDLDEPFYRNRLLGVYGNTSCTDMPWVGVADEDTGDGVMTLVETPFDAFIQLRADERDRAWPQVIWRNTMDRFGYDRRASFRFVAEGGYVAQANVYREYAAETGTLVPMAEKAARKPLVERLRGAAVLWGSTDVWRFIEEARVEGIVRGLLSNAVHGLHDKTRLRDLNEMGYLTNVYDNFSDIREGPRGWGTDSIEDAAYHVRPGMGPKLGWLGADTGQLHDRSSALALEAMRTYVPGDLVEHGYNARFIDVSIAINLTEDYHPDHTFDRRQDMRYRRGVFDWLNEYGLVLGTEHGNDWGADLVEYSEGALSGPFWWQGGGAWAAGHLRRAVSRDDYTPQYLKFGHGYDTRIPLWDLVYHDSVVSTWYWGDGPGFHYEAAPDIAERKDLFNILYGAMPLLWRDDKGYGWTRNRERFLRTCLDTLPVFEAVAFARMKDHAFLTDDKSLQRTRFDSGHVVTVNFSDAPVPVPSETLDREVTLAGPGFLAEGPGLFHGRLVEDGDEVTRTTSPTWVLLDTPGERTHGAITGVGRILAFRAGDERWQLAVAEGAACEVDVAALTGFPADELDLLELDGRGRTVRFAHEALRGGRVTVETDGHRRYFALTPRRETGLVSIHPPDLVVDVAQPVTLSTNAAGADVRYTLDGTEPAAESHRYDAPITLAGGEVVRARAFHGDTAVGRTVEARPRAFRTLFESGVMRGGDEAVRVDVDVSGCARLRLLVGNADDSCWSDRANWGDAAFIRADGERIYLSDLEPVYAKQTYHQLAMDRNTHNQPLTIAGRTFDRGLGSYSEAEIIFDIEETVERFVAWVGVDDMSNPPPDAPPAFRGTVTFTVQGVLRPLPPEPPRIELAPVKVEEPVRIDRDALSDRGQHISPIAFDMAAPWMRGTARLRTPEVLMSPMGTHFSDWVSPDVLPLNELETYPDWHEDQRTGALRYDVMTREGLEFGATATPREDSVDVEFRVRNRTGRPLAYVAPNLCLNFQDAPLFHQPWDLTRLLVAFDGKLQPMANTTPTPEERGTDHPWLHFLTRDGVGNYDGPRDLGHSWFVDQVTDDENLMAVVSADGTRLIGYTWHERPGIQMSNCGYPCLHTGPGPVLDLGLGEAHHWRGRVYFVDNDPEALLERVRRDRAAWAAP